MIPRPSTHHAFPAINVFVPNPGAAVPPACPLQLGEGPCLPRECPGPQAGTLCQRRRPHGPAGRTRRLQPRPLPTPAWRLSHFIKYICLLVYLYLWLFEGMESVLVTPGDTGSAPGIWRMRPGHSPQGKGLRLRQGPAPNQGPQEPSPGKGQRGPSQKQSLRQGFRGGRDGCRICVPLCKMKTQAPSSKFGISRWL